MPSTIHGNRKHCIERSKILLIKWLAALFLTGSRKGVNARQIHCVLRYKLQVNVILDAPDA